MVITPKPKNQVQDVATGTATTATTAAAAAATTNIQDTLMRRSRLRLYRE
jgi:hypothetical protein